MAYYEHKKVRQELQMVSLKLEPVKSPTLWVGTLTLSLPRLLLGGAIKSRHIILSLTQSKEAKCKGTFLNLLFHSYTWTKKTNLRC